MVQVYQLLVFDPQIALFGPAARARSHFLAAVVFERELDNGGGGGPRVARRHEKPVLTVAHALREPSSISGDDRESGGHRLEGDESTGLGGGG
jgi:hypothetical protein